MSSRKKLILLSILILLICNYSNQVRFQVKAWTSDFSINTPISVQAKNETASRVIKSANGEAIIVWRDYDAGNLYAQKLDNGGNLKWQENGIQVGYIPYSIVSDAFDVVGDGGSGVIITWMDKNDQNLPRIYAQRIDGNGNFVWGENGILISTNTPDFAGADRPRVIVGADNMPIFLWEDLIGPTRGMIKKLDENGNELWNKQIGRISGRLTPEISADNNGGAVLVLKEKSILTPYYTLWVRRIDLNGQFTWAPNGVELSDSLSGISRDFFIGNFDNDKYLVIWKEQDINLFAQLLDNSGNKLWSIDGVDLKMKSAAFIVSINEGQNAIVTAAVNSPNGSDIIAQIINPNGQILWNDSSGTIHSQQNLLSTPNAVSDGHGGAILAWSDKGLQTDPNFNKEDNIYAQRFDNQGNKLWGVNDVLISNASSKQLTPSISLVGNSSIVLSWTDYRNGLTNGDIYAQKVNLDGTLGGDATTPTPTPEPTITPIPPEECAQVTEFLLPNFGNEDGNPLRQKDERWRDEALGGGYFENSNGEKVFVPFKIDDDGDGKLDEDAVEYEGDKKAAVQIDNDSDGRYSEDSPETIGKWGCTLTSATMIVNYFAKQQDVNKTFTPSDLNNWSKENYGYSTNGSKPLPDKNNPQYTNWGMLHYNKVSEFAKKEGIKMSVKSTKNTLREEMCQLNSAILGVNNDSDSETDHYIAASGNTQKDGVQTFRIHDPERTTTTTLSESYGSYLQSIVYEPVFPNEKSYLNIRTFSDPAKLFIVDPLGRRSGYDPVTDQSYNEIPDAWYGIEQITADDETHTKQSIRTIYINSPIEGLYQLIITGSETETSGIEIRSKMGSNDEVIEHISENTVNEETNSYEFTVSPDPEKNLQDITRKIDISIDPLLPNDIILYPVGPNWLPVTIYSTPTFDATKLNIDGITFGPNGIEPDRKRRFNKDYNKDKRKDVQIYFKTDKVGIDSDTSELCLQAKDENDQDLEGCDEVQVMTLKEYIQYLRDRRKN